MSDPPERCRLDEALVARGLARSRARARDAIIRGRVTVDGVPARKSGQRVSLTSQIAINDNAQAYVARSALKLTAALDHFRIDVSGAHALDIGASTGGFSQVLLRRGAAHVVALDVGHDQLHPDLRADPRVTVIEGLNARHLARADLPYMPNRITIDVSFISQRLILPAMDTVAAPDAVLVTLVKPQFEVGAGNPGKNGVVTDPAMRLEAVARITRVLVELGWTVSEPLESPMPGARGNREFSLAAWKQGATWKPG